jgi:hypothetical protein
MLDTGEDRGDVRQALVQSLAVGAASDEEPILALIREIDDDRSPDASYYRLLLDCSEEEESAPGQLARYFISADVVADNLEEAVSFVGHLHPTDANWNGRVDEYEVLEQRPDEPHGVYSRTRRQYYDQADA